MYSIVNIDPMNVDASPAIAHGRAFCTPLGPSSHSHSAWSVLQVFRPCKANPTVRPNSTRTHCDGELLYVAVDLVPIILIPTHPTKADTNTVPLDRHVKDGSKKVRQEHDTRINC